MEKLLKKLVDAPGVSGYEKNVREVIKNEIKNHVDEIKVDKIGNLIARKGSGSPKIMIAAHMDEIGLIVKYIDKSGFIRFDTVGGWDERILPGRKVKIYGSKGPVVGVIGSRPVHLMDKEELKQEIKANKLFIDVGASSDKDVKKLGISVGDFISNYGSFDKLCGSRYTGYGLDNRIGCLELIEIAKNLKNFKGTLYAVGTVQEETGLIGVRGSAFGINPDVLIALDTGLVGDTPETKKSEVPASIGKGPILSIKDSIYIVNPAVRKWIEDTAKQNKIPLQYSVTNVAAEDSSMGAIIREGIPSGGVSTGTRYLHTLAEVFDMNDVKHVIKLMVAAIKNAHKYF